ncbi:MAG: hypothetical protein LUC41_00470 [Clostridiales bacterium]|nr:hypothetical protein [Clostridiales bacterium]
MTQKELFDRYGEETAHIWYYLGNDESQKGKFLQFAKDMDLHWMNGDDINPETDTCGAVMGVDRKGRIGQVSLYLWSRLPGMDNRDAVKRIDFATGQCFDENGYYMASKIVMSK